MSERPGQVDTVDGSASPEAEADSLPGSGARAGGGPRPGGWWARNWRWFLPVCILIPSVLSLGCLGGMLINVFWVVKTSPTYRQMVELAESDPRLSERIGEPMRWSLLAFGGDPSEAMEGPPGGIHGGNGVDPGADSGAGEGSSGSGRERYEVVATLSGPRGTVHLHAVSTRDRDADGARWRLESVLVTPDAGDSFDLLADSPR